MNEFMQLPNFKRCEVMWRQYMMEHHQVSIPDSDTDSRPRKLLFQIMQDVRDNYTQEPGVDLRTLNNVSMNLARDVFLRKGTDVQQQQPQKQQQPQPPHPLQQQQQQQQQRSLERDQALYAGRKSLSGAPRPEATSRIPIQDGQYTEHISANMPHQIPKLDETSSPHVADNPMDANETARRLAERDEDALLAAILRQPPVIQDSTVPGATHLSQAAQASPGPPSFVHASGPFHPVTAPDDDTIRAANDRMQVVEGFTAPAATLSSAVQHDGRGYSALLQNVPKSVLSDRYVIVNGFDRYWQQSPLRFQYTVSVGGGNDPLSKSLQGTYRNVHSLQVTRLVIPMEIVPRSTYKGLDLNHPITTCSGNTGHAVKGSYRHAASLSFPYVMLSIEGFADVYDGTNTAARSAFCQLVYRNSYKAPNGRGFVIMEPMQEEKKIFTPSPLASLNRLSISILRPSGALFNDSLDDATIKSIAYEPFNRQYIRVMLNNFFDMNEFFVGDSVVIQDYNSQQALPVPGKAWVPDTTASYGTLNSYMNRSEGHEIVELGLANDSGYFQSFCIMAPGSLNAKIGSIVLDAPAIAAVVEMPNAPCPTVPFGGAVMNISLQNVVSFKLGVLAGEPPKSLPV